MNLSGNRAWVVLLLAACGSSLPELPTPALEDYSPAVRRQLQAALAKALADPGDAARVGDLGRALYAYGLHEPAEQAFARARAIEPDRFDWLYLLGVALADQGKYAEAELVLREAAALDPKDLPTAVRLADLFEQTGDSNQAVAMLEALPSEPAVDYRLGRLYSQSDRDKARDHLEKALASEPDYREALNALANVYTLDGRAEDARKQLALFEQTDPTPRRHYTDPLIDELDELKANDARTVYEQGLAYQNSGDFDQARARYSSVLEIDPNHLPTHVGLIAVYGSLGERQLAESHFDRAVAVNPDTAEAHYNVGILRLGAGAFEPAAEAFDRAIEINPSNVPALVNSAVALEQLGRESAADARLRSALELDPADASANFHVGRRAAQNGRYGQALTHLEKSLEREGDETAVKRFVLALVQAQLGDQENARRNGALALELARSSGQTELVARITRQLGL